MNTFLNGRITEKKTQNMRCDQHGIYNKIQMFK